MPYQKTENLNIEYWISNVEVGGKEKEGASGVQIRDVAYSSSENCLPWPVGRRETACETVSFMKRCKNWWEKGNLNLCLPFILLKGKQIGRNHYLVRIRYCIPYLTNHNSDSESEISPVTPWAGNVSDLCPYPPSSAFSTKKIMFIISCAEISRDNQWETRSCSPLWTL